MARQPIPGDSVGIQVPVGRIKASRARWQTIFEAHDKPMIYRLCNTEPRDRADPGNSLVVDVDGVARRQVRVDVGTSVDVMASKIRVKAGTGGASHFVEGWYVLVS